MNDPRIPARDDCVLPHVLDRYCRESPEQVFVVFDNEESWSYAATREQATRAAHGLMAHGLVAGGKLVTWLPCGPLGLRCFIAAGYCGAVYVGINTAYKGALLEHVLDLSEADVMVAHPDLVDRLLEIERRGRIRTVFTSADKVAADHARFAAAGIELRSTTLLDHPGAAITPPDLQPWDAQSICFTSGTTGPSKAVVSSYLHLYTMGVECLEGIGPDDRHVVNLPLFHAGGTLTVYGALARGASIALLEGFQTDTFLDFCRRTGATAEVEEGVGLEAFEQRDRGAAGEGAVHGERATGMEKRQVDDVSIVRSDAFEALDAHRVEVEIGRHHGLRRAGRPGREADRLRVPRLQVRRGDRRSRVIEKSRRPQFDAGRGEAGVIRGHLVGRREHGPDPTPALDLEQSIDEVRMRDHHIGLRQVEHVFEQRSLVGGVDPDVDRAAVAGRDETAQTERTARQPGDELAAGHEPVRHQAVRRSRRLFAGGGVRPALLVVEDDEDLLGRFATVAVQHMRQDAVVARGYAGVVHRCCPDPRR